MASRADQAILQTPTVTRLRIVGDAGAILLLERTARSFMMRRSAVVTLTRTYVDKVGDRCRVVDTRPRRRGGVDG
ncbi:MAG: hypothetical protein CSA65_02625 [Proteobacteria bacterium]|nr:MAG: hypothetical protein CSB49_04160 [Pseudomonadota bacterium]PIE19394.1 MAG: hypothetical protein CSA65_02625 [Pseudomonadota bacterium]